MGDSFDVKLSTVTGDKVVQQELNHVSLTWKISDFKNRVWRRDDSIHTPQFRCAGDTWNLWIYPHGTREYPGGYVCVGLPCRSKYVVSAKFTIPRHGGQETIYEVEKYSFKDKIEMMHYGEVCRNYLEDGVFTIKCDMTVFEADAPDVQHGKGEDPPEKKDADTNTSSEDFSSLHLCDDSTSEEDDLAALSADFAALHENPRSADVVLKLEENEFPAHKAILRSRSKVFEAMFEHDMQENRRDAVDLSGVAVDTVELMLRYIYSGRVRQLSPEEALNLYVAADRYDLQGLVVICRKILLNQLCIDNICETASIADLHNDQFLMDAVKCLLYKNMKDIFKTDKWLVFAKGNPILSLNLIQSAAMNN